MKNYKLGVGPMSREIIECINEYGDINTNRLMVVASRNQVDYTGGYVCTPNDLTNAIFNPNILVCRDHCGPYFKDTDKGLSLEDAMVECKKTIDADIFAGFDLIHIDVSRIAENQLVYAKELIDYTLSLSPNIMLEFGSENNTGKDLTDSLSHIEEQLAFIDQYSANVVFFVTQTGSFTQHTQTGAFDVTFNTPIADKIHSHGFLYKEHNADYLDSDGIALRRIAGVDSLNNAPQLGTVQTRILKEISNNNTEWIAFADLVYKSNLWTKWLPSNIIDPDLAVIVAGHYLFNTHEYTALIQSIDTTVFMDRLRAAMFDIFDTYTT
jgi:hypothetical protein